MAEAATFALLAAIGGVYALGLSRAWTTAGRGRLVRTSQAWLFAGGMVALAVALLPPLAARTDHSLTAHMIQHVLLLVVAAPLLALGAPLPTLVWALPDRWRRRVSAGWRRLLRSHSAHWLVWAGGALVAESLVMAAWHLPGAYRAALHHDDLHVLEHASFVATAVVFAWAVGVGSARRHGSAVAIVFAAALPGSALGAALTLAARPWYDEYPSLADQQMAGVVMWAFAGVAYVVAAACLFGVWLNGLERETPGRPLVPAVGR
ncbi:MAG: cytochrome c oxidase assembly protein [Actinomycetota bacterium]|nr:cytochrome c oxidase assembly protein [Actinomycetota bacterium]